MENKLKLQSLIDSSWSNYIELTEDEINIDFSDSQLTVERIEAKSYVEGLEAAYQLFFGESYNSPINPATSQ